MTKDSKIRRLIQQHPELALRDVAKQAGATYGYVYAIRAKMRKEQEALAPRVKLTFWESTKLLFRGW